MGLETTISLVFHHVFAALWTGSVLYTTYALLPTARAGDINAQPLETMAGKLTWVSRGSAVMILLTGGHLAMTNYGVDGLLEGNGHLVVAMIVLWIVLMALVEIGTSRLADGASQRKVRSPADNAIRIFQAASIVAVLVLIDAGVLAAGGL